MLSIVQSLGYQLRHGLLPFGRRQPSAKRLAILLFVAGAAASTALRNLLPATGQLVLWAALMLYAAWLLRQCGRPFFGPVFFYDLVRSSRRGEQVGHRCVYALLLVGVLATVYLSWFPNQALTYLLHSTSMTLGARARFAASFFTSFMSAQLVVVFLITPLYTASAIAEQKERRTLDFLLITDLTDREIVLGLFGARLAKLLLLLLTGLPVLSLLEFLGGVDPVMVLAGFVATCMLVVSLASVSILVSVHARSTLGAVILSYLVGIVLLGCAFPSFHLAAAPATAKLRSTGMAASPTFDMLVALITIVFVYGVVALLCCRSAVAQLRRVAMAQAEGSGGIRAIMTRPIGFTPKLRPHLAETARMRGGWGPYPEARDRELDFVPGPSPSRSHRTRPRVGANALLWKEIHAENALGLAALRRVRPLAALAGLGFLFLVLGGLNAPQYRGYFSDYSQAWVLRMEIVVSFLLLVIVALSASRRLSGERERRTLDNLLMLPVGIESILFAKWLGSILSVSRLWWLLIPIWVVGVLTGGLSVFAVPFLAAAIMVYAGFVASVGLWFSSASGSTMRASLLALLVALVFLAVPGALTTRSSFSLYLLTEHPFQMWESLLTAYGFSPPDTLEVLTFRDADLLKKGNELLEFARILAAVTGLQFYIAATALLWLLTRARLRNR
jgi:ABC-type transport system involved in multi-copper enzyme maturation permease subunit